MCSARPVPRHSAASVSRDTLETPLISVGRQSVRSSNPVRTRLGDAAAHERGGNQHGQTYPGQSPFQGGPYQQNPYQQAPAGYGQYPPYGGGDPPSPVAVSGAM